MAKTYSAQQVAKEAMLRYAAGATINKDDIDTVRKALERICKKIMIYSGDSEGGQRYINLWEKATTKNGKATRYIFTERDKELAISSYEMIKYLSQWQNSESVYPSAVDIMNNIEEAERQNNIARQYVEEKSSEEGTVQNEEEFGVSGRDLRSAKLMMMVEALFLQYFTPIDMVKLEEDLELYKLGAGGTSTPETVAAEKRLMDFLNYCTPKKA